MNDSKITEPIVPPLPSNLNLKIYYCPHCGKSLFKGKVKRLNMVCQHCQKMIAADEGELLNKINQDIFR